MSEDARITLYVFTPLIALGVITMIVCIIKMLKTYARTNAMRAVHGVVIGHQAYETRMNSSSGHGSDRVTLLKAIVRYSAPSGATHEVVHPVGTSFPSPPVGAQVVVRFDPRRPERGEIESALASYFAPSVVLFVVTVFVVILIGVGLSVVNDERGPPRGRPRPGAKR